MGAPYWVFYIHYVFLLFRIILLDEASRVQRNRDTCLRWRSHKCWYPLSPTLWGLHASLGLLLQKSPKFMIIFKQLSMSPSDCPGSHLICSNCSDCKCVCHWGISWWSWHFSTQIFPCHLVDYNFRIEKFCLKMIEGKYDCINLGNDSPWGKTKHSVHKMKVITE